MKLRHIFTFICLSAVLLLVTSCIDEELPSDDTPRGNFEALWQLMDERYCFFDYKQQELGVDWNEVYSRYGSRITSKMDRYQLFEVLTGMLSELKDGHVNLGASYNYGRNWSFWEEYPENYYDSIARSYLGIDYYIASVLKYKILDDNVGYVRVETFEQGIGDGNVSEMLLKLMPCKGLIIDVRNNGGGQLTAAHTLASHFTNERKLVGYTMHKTGKGHNDFSTPEPQYIDPSDGMRWQKPVVVITNRQCFSATNDFVNCMNNMPDVTLLGDRTGGGSGMPFTQELPNGWSVRYSAVVTLDSDHQHIEFGIEPDIKVAFSPSDIQRRKDTLIEAARKLFQAGDDRSVMQSETDVLPVSSCNGMQRVNNVP